jgi:hypothetical protein
MKYRKLYQAILTIFGTTGLAVFAPASSAVGTADLGTVSVTPLTASYTGSKHGWDGANNFDYGWSHNTIWYIFTVTSPSNVDVRMESQSDALNPAFTLWATNAEGFVGAEHTPDNAYRAPDSFPIHPYNQVAGAPATGTNNANNWLAPGCYAEETCSTNGITGIAGYVNSGDTGWTNGDGLTVGAGAVGEGFSGQTTVGSLPSGGQFADLKLYDLAPGTYLMATGGSCHDNSCINITGTTLYTLTVTQFTQLEPPTANAGSDLVVAEGSMVTLDGRESSDKTSSIASYRWVQSRGPSVAFNADQGTTAAQPQFTAPLVNADTILSFDLVVTNAEGTLSSADTVKVLVRDSSDAPSAQVGPDQSTTSGGRVTLDGSPSSTPDEERQLTYHWTQLLGPKVTLSDNDSATAAKPTFSAPKVSKNTLMAFQLKVEDDYPKGPRFSDSVISNVTIVKKNTQPIADAGSDFNIRAGSLAILDGTGSYDPDHDVTSYQWTQTGGPEVQLSSLTAAKPSFIAPKDAIGKPLEFSLKVSDSGQPALTHQDTVTVQVTEANNSPTVTIIPELIWDEKRIHLNTRTQDPEGDELKFVWKQTAGPKVTLNKKDGPSLIFTPPAKGTGTSGLTFSLTATDNHPSGQKSGKATSKIGPLKQIGSMDCASATSSLDSLWPPSQGMVQLKVVGITSQKAYSLTITGVTQDEPVKNPSAGDTTGPDAKILKDKATATHPQVMDTVMLRAERQLSDKTGNGRVYAVQFHADDGSQSCTGSVKVEVPVTPGKAAVDEGQKFKSTQ